MTFRGDPNRAFCFLVISPVFWILFELFRPRPPVLQAAQRDSARRAGDLQAASASTCRSRSTIRRANRSFAQLRILVPDFHRRLRPSTAC
jgi:hypothetical protein